MISVGLLVAAVAAVFWPQVRDLADKLKARAPALSRRHLAGAALLAAAAVAFSVSGSRTPEPTPAPDAGPFSLAGLWMGATASEDAATVGSLCLEIADELEYDGTQPHPYLTTGVAVDELRKTARVLRCRGISIGDRQPRARDAIAKYLDEQVGADGGPLTPAQRAAWVSAYRDVGRAASEAAR